MARIKIPKSVKQQVRQAAQNRCGYCLSPQRLMMSRLQVEHIIPLAKGGSNDETNLWLACSICNGHKSDKITAIDPETGKDVQLFNPRTQDWFEHFRWSNDGLRVIGITPTGRATVEALHLDRDPDAIITRSWWVEAGWHPPTE